jgi:hypothetical protein
MMATLTQVTLACDLCGSTDDVQTQAIGLDGKIYEIDLCPEDNEDLSRVAAGYIAKARKITSRGTPRRKARKPRPAGKQGTRPAGKQGTRPAGKQGKGIVVYGILPDDIEVADATPGIGENPGPLRIVYSDGLAALISELEPPGRLGTPDDRRAYREILDGTATEAPVLPLRFGTVLASEDAVADELLTAHHDEFAGALEELDGRAEFVVRGRYVGQADGSGRPDATQALEAAMREHCVASVVREPAHERDGVEVAFLVDADQESEVERVIENLARECKAGSSSSCSGPRRHTTS